MDPNQTISFKDFVNQGIAHQAEKDTVSQYMKDNFGAIYDPTTHGYKVPPKSANQTASDALTTRNADTQFANSQPLDPKDLQGYVDQTGQPAKPGITKNDLNSGKYSYKAPLSESQQQALDQKAQDKSTTQRTLQGIIDEIQGASNVLNTHSGVMGVDSNPEQYLKGLFASHNGNRYADYLNNGAVGELGALTHDLLNIGRFSPEEIQKFKGNIPSPYDTKETANYKMTKLQRLFNDKFGAAGQTDTTSSTPQGKPSLQSIFGGG